MLFLLAILAAAAPAPVAGPPLATLDAIRAAPDAYDGKWVRLRGQVDQCFRFSCALCPEEATPAHPERARCLAIGFDRQAGGADRFGFNFDPVYRYATVDLVARFDKACLAGPCSDRATLLRDARVLDVIGRRRSADGLRAGDREPLADPPAAAAARLLDEIGYEVPPPGTDHARYRVFAGAEDPAIERGAIVCRAFGRDDEPGTWPDDWTAALFAPSTEDRFKCHLLRKVRGHWSFQTW
jgi:hypothetical protein